MRPLACLALLLPALALASVAQGSDRALESLEQRFSQQLRRRIDADLGAELARRGAGPPGAGALPARMRCRVSRGATLDCVVLSTRTAAERLAGSR